MAGAKLDLGYQEIGLAESVGDTVMTECLNITIVFALLYRQPGEGGKHGQKAVSF